MRTTTNKKEEDERQKKKIMANILVLEEEEEEEEHLTLNGFQPASECRSPNEDFFFSSSSSFKYQK